MKRMIRLLAMLLCISCLLSACSESPARGTVRDADTSDETQDTEDDRDRPDKPKDTDAPPKNGAITVKPTSVVVPGFELTDGFIRPFEKYKTAPPGYVGISSAGDFSKLPLNPSGSYILLADLDLSELQDYEPFDFTGVLNGNGYTITTESPAVFGVLSSAQISNLGVIFDSANVQIEFSGRSSKTGCGIACKADGATTMANCFAKGIIDFHADVRPASPNAYNLEMALFYFGGIVGMIDGESQITDCFNDTDISLNVAMASNITVSSIDAGMRLLLGGIAGFSDAKNLRVTNCYNSGDLVCVLDGSEGGERTLMSVGGIIGYMQGNNSISNSFNNGDINSECTILGYEIQKSIVGARINVSSFYTSGIAGATRHGGLNTDRTIIRNCFNSGDINYNIAADDSVLNEARINGITTEPRAASHACSIIDSYNAGDITGNAGDELISVCGIAVTGMIEGSYNIGALPENAGAIGSLETENSGMQYCYFLDNNKNATPSGALVADVAMLDEKQMVDEDSYGGFDFDTTWQMGDSDYPYPVFRDALSER